MLQSLRSQAKSWVFGLLFGLLILSFAIWGIGDIFRGGSRDRVVAEVGDQEISARAFLEQYRRELRQLEARLGGRVDTDVLNRLGLGPQVAGQMIQRSLFDQAANDLGLTADDALVAQTIRNDPNFAQLGQFNRTVYEQVLRANGLSVTAYEAALRRDLARAQLIGAVTAPGTVPKTLLEPIYRHNTERRIAEVLTIASDKFPVAIPDQATLEAYYKEHAAKDYMAPAYRRIDAIMLRPEDLMGEIQVSDEQLHDEYETRRSEFETPERRTVEQMLFATEDEAKKAYDELAQNKPFAEVAKEPGNLQGDIALGTFTRETMPLPELTEPTFALQKDGFSAPVQSPLGWHIVRVTQIEPGVSKSFDEVRDELAKTIKRERAVDVLYQLASNVEDELAGGADMEEAAKRLSLPFVRIDAVDAEGKGRDGKPAKAMPDYPEFLRTAFDTEVGQESNLIETKAGPAFFLKVDEEIPPAQKPLDSIHDKVVADWQNEQRAAKAKAEAERLAELVRNGTEMAKLSADNSLPLVTTPAFDRDGAGVIGNPEAPLQKPMVESIFGAKVGEVVVAPSGKDFQVGRVKEILEGDPKAADAVRQATNEALGRAIAEDWLSELTAALRGRYPVTVNQSAIDQALQ